MYIRPIFGAILLSCLPSFIKSFIKFQYFAKYSKILSHASPVIIGQYQLQSKLECLSECSKYDQCKFVSIFYLKDNKCLCQLWNESYSKILQGLQGKSAVNEFYHLHDSRATHLDLNFQWTSWTNWSNCSKNCGSETKFRTKFCLSCNESAVFISKEISPCTSAPCRQKRQTQRLTSQIVPGTSFGPAIWGGWSEWSRCPSPCTGHQERSRKCADSQLEVRPCTCTSNPVVHQVPASWAAWNIWSTCSATCGRGTQTRQRNCIPIGRCTGTVAGRPTETRACQNAPCTLGWGAWGRWSLCTRTCGGGGRRTRSRTCQDRLQNCPGLNLETDTCGNQPCPAAAEWSPWSPWSSCSLTCGAGTRARTRQCSSLAGCRGNSVEQSSCFTQCPVAQWLSWEPWSPCSVTCGDGGRTRSRRCSSPLGNCPGVGTSTSTCSTVPCPVSEWSSWQPWGPCSVTCGNGGRARSRTCSDITGPCAGPSSQTETCGAIPCPVSQWSSWEPWGLCSVTCGNGGRTRFRSCSNVAGPCVGPNSQSETCSTIQCPVSQWSEWQPWGTCSVTCGSGGRTRIRTCSNVAGPCVGPNSQTDTCSTISCPVSQWSVWDPWGPCSVSCGTGSRVRYRTCSNLSGPCPGPSSSTETCSSPCPVSQWSEWQPWGPCSVSCGSGGRLRTRTCSNTSGPCAGPSRESGTCSSAPCPMAQWLQWEPWSSCTVTCGNGGRTRTRVCSDPNGSCFGIPIETSTCFVQCPLDNWIQWDEWSPCSATCGQGNQVRTRSCSGSQCQGDSFAMQPCFSAPCCSPMWSQWDLWSACSATCGQGVQVRSRRCDDCNGRVSCPGQGTESRVCAAPRSCATFRDWSSWGSCSVTCGSGIRTRQRDCMDNSVNCFSLGSPTEESVCQLPPCSQWSPWSSWSACRGSCGQGIRTRTRTCTGGQCSGMSEDSEPCAADCQTPPTWIEWGPWGICMPLRGTCGVGTRQRRRMCLGGLERECEGIWRNQGVEDRACDVICYKDKARKKEVKKHDD